jgi:hypothetical protein
LGKADDDKKHEIKKGPMQDIIVTDVEEMPVQCESEVCLVVLELVNNKEEQFG